MILRIAQMRIVPEKGKLEANHKRLMAVLREVATGPIDVVVTSECYLDGYVCIEDRVTAENIRDYAVDPAASTYVSSVADWARENGAWVILGCSRLAPEGVYNSALIINRQGELAGHYDKTHCQGHEKKYRPGERLVVMDSDFGPFGVMICADRRWPEVVRSLALRGARIIFNPTYGMHGEKNLHVMVTRSYESEVFIAFTHPFLSLLTDPTGEVRLNETRQDVHFSVSEINLEQVDRVRAGSSAHLKDRRPELYTF